MIDSSSSRFEGTLVPENRDPWVTLAQHAGPILWWLSADGLALELPAWQAFTGQHPAAIMGDGWLIAVHPTEHALIRDLWYHARTVRQPLMTTVRVRRADSVYRTVHITLTPLVQEGDTITAWIGCATDETTLTRSQQRLAVQQRLSAILSECHNLTNAMHLVLAIMGEVLEWQVTAMWQVTPAGLHQIATWQMPEALLHANMMVLQYGDGLPGRVWQEAAPLAIVDLAHEPRFLRASAAQAAGLESAFAFPLIGKGGVVGVIECFSALRETPDEELVQLTSGIGHQLGQFLDHLQLTVTHDTSQALAEAILATSMDAIIACDQQEHILVFNAAAEQMFGYRQQDIIGTSLVELIIPPALRESHRRGFLRYLATGTSTILDQRLELVGLRHDGTTFPLELSITHVPTTDDHVFTATIRDITERQRLAQALTARIQQLEVLVEMMPDAVTCYNQAGEILLANTLSRRWFGLDRDTVHRSLPWQQRLGHYRLLNEQRQPLSLEQQPIARVLRGERLTGAQAPDMILLLATGEELQLHISGTPIVDEQDQIQGGILVGRDVTIRRKSDQQTQAMLDALVDLMQDLIDATDMQSGDQIAQRLVEVARPIVGADYVTLAGLTEYTEHWMPLATTGRSPEQEAAWRATMGQYTLAESLSASALDQVRHGLVAEAVSPQTDNRPSYGTQAALFAPLRRPDGTLIGVLSVAYTTAHHFTEQERYLTAAMGRMANIVLEQEQLRHARVAAEAQSLALHDANRRMDEFLNMVSHELRTPLTSIRGYTQLAQRRVQRLNGHDDDLQRIEALLRDADHQTTVLNRLVGDLLTVARQGVQRDLAIHVHLCHLDAIVQSVVEQQRMAWPQRTIQLHLPETGSSAIMGDADRLSQVITNYLGNALKYAPAHLPIIVQIAEEREHVRVTVQDHGPGVPVQEQPVIWDRYYRGDQALHSGAVGMGVGLYLCRWIIHLHHGQVGVDSQVGAGARFWFTVPIATRS